MAERIVDVSALEPPEPLERTLAAAEALAPGDYLVMRHRRDPCLLPANLTARGFVFRQGAGRESAVEVVIWRQGDVAAAAAATAATSCATGTVADFG